MPLAAHLEDNCVSGRGAGFEQVHVAALPTTDEQHAFVDRHGIIGAGDLKPCGRGRCDAIVRITQRLAGFEFERERTNLDQVAILKDVITNLVAIHVNMGSAGEIADVDVGAVLHDQRVGLRDGAAGEMDARVGPRSDDRDRPIAEVRRITGPAAIAGLLIMIASGALIFTGGAEAYYTGYWFRLKMVLLVIAIVFHFTIARAIAYAQTGRFPAVVNALTGLVGLLLWFSVGWAGRAIAFIP